MIMQILSREFSARVGYKNIYNLFALLRRASVVSNRRDTAAPCGALVRPQNRYAAAATERKEESAGGREPSFDCLAAYKQLG